MRRILAPALAALVLLSGVSVVAAADPSPAIDVVASPEPPSPVDPTPAPTPSPGPDATADPRPEPSPAAEPASSPAAPRSARPQAATTSPGAVDTRGRPIAAGRYLVLLKGDADPTKVAGTHRKRDGMIADRAFRHAFRGFAAKLDKAQRAALLADPNVAAVVPDEVIEVQAQSMPTGISRVGAQLSPISQINGLDERVDADVAIVDTGIGPHSDLNIAGGYNCSTSDRTRWYDENGHGTHVAGTVGAKDNTWGVVGVAPGVRLWAVRILNSSGAGLLSWYVCGLDWILAQRDPSDSSRPLIEAVNMSVAKTGSDDGNCGRTNNDVLHQAICRLYTAGITVVAAAANASTSAARFVPAAYNEVITVSALADTDGRPGGGGGNKCYSWGTYDRDDTFADFSNYGSDIDLIAPGKCILSTKPGPTYGYSSGTSMAAPHVTGAVALYKATRPFARPSQVRESLRYLGNLNWFTNTDPDPYHEPLLNVSRIGPLGTFTLSPGTTTTIGSKGGTVLAPFRVVRSPTFFERVQLSVSNVPSGWTATFPAPSLFGWSATSGTVRLTAPRDVKPGTYHVTVTGANWGRTDSTTLSINVAADVPTAKPPVATVLTSSTLGKTSGGATTVAMRATWAAATDPSDAIVRYEVQRSVNGGVFGWTVTTSAGTRSAAFSGLALGAAHRFRVRAQDSDGSWSAWATASASLTPSAVSDRSSLVAYSGTWIRYANASSTDGWVTSSSRAGARARYRFTGRAVALVALAAPTRGKASIYIDGTYRATIDTYASTTTYRKVVYVATWSAAGTHTIELRVSATAGRPTVSLDGFLVLR